MCDRDGTWVYFKHVYQEKANFLYCSFYQQKCSNFGAFSEIWISFLFFFILRFSTAKFISARLDHLAVLMN